MKFNFFYLFTIVCGFASFVNPDRTAQAVWIVAALLSYKFAEEKE